MKTRFAAAALLIGCLFLQFARAGDAVEPASCTITNLRDEAQVMVSASSFYKATTLRFTNCVLYAGSSTNAGAQGLDGVTVDLDVGSVASNIAYVATVTSTNGGIWACDITVPDWTDQVYLQVKVTDANTNSYIYPWKRINVKDSL